MEENISNRIYIGLGIVSLILVFILYKIIEFPAWIAVFVMSLIICFMIIIFGSIKTNDKYNKN